MDLKEGLLKRTIRFRDRKGRETDLVSRRFVNMAQQHLAAIEWVVTARNWSGRLKVRSALDGTGAFRYSPFELLFRSLFLTIRTYAPNWRQERNFAVHFSRALMDVETWPVEKREHILACFQRHFGRKRYLYI